jgi:hypothetical protein
MEYVSPRLNKRGSAESEEYVPEGDVTTEQRPAESGGNASEVDVANETAYKQNPVEASSSSGVTSMLGGPDRDPPVDQAQLESAEVPKQKFEPSAEAGEGDGNGTTVSGSEDVGPRRYLPHETEKQLVILMISMPICSWLWIGHPNRRLRKQTRARSGHYGVVPSMLSYELYTKGCV